MSVPPFFAGAISRGLVPWRGLIGLLLGTGLLVGCSGFSTGEKPLPDSTFTHLLTELHLARARNTEGVSYPQGLRDSIFARHGVRPAAFDSTLRYYSRHPKAFEALYQTVIDTLQALQVPDVRRSGPKTIPDSVYRRRGGERPQQP